jgi:uncharacterized membrane protein
MSEADRPYGLLNEMSGIEETQDPRRQRHLPPSAALSWLGQGWQDLVSAPAVSLSYGVLVFVVSLASVWTMLVLRWDYFILPALAGFMIVGPLLAVGLYDVSRARTEGRRASFRGGLAFGARALRPLYFAGLILSLLFLLWMRAAVLIYALFFGYRAFPGLEHLLPLLATTPLGWGMIVVGSAVGGLFAALAFAASAFSIPMVVNERTDVLTAMGTSITLVWNNLPVMLAWGALVAVLFVLSAATAFAGLIVVFPLLGYGTWHAYRAIR